MIFQIKYECKVQHEDRCSDLSRYKSKSSRKEGGREVADCAIPENHAILPMNEWMTRNGKWLCGKISSFDMSLSEIC